MKMIVVGVADCRAARAKDDMLITYALGSCIGVTAWDPVARVGGLLHFLLPDSAMGSSTRGNSPAVYADTGVPLLLRQCVDLGGVEQRMIVRAAGGAKILEHINQFDVGNRNRTALRMALSKAGVPLRGEATGGTECRTVSLEAYSGRMLIREGGQPWRELAPRRRYSPADPSGE